MVNGRFSQIAVDAASASSHWYTEAMLKLRVTMPLLDGLLAIEDYAVEQQSSFDKAARGPASIQKYSMLDLALG